jgi:hypothetical protein
MLPEYKASPALTLPVVVNTILNLSAEFLESINCLP